MSRLKRNPAYMRPRIAKAKRTQALRRCFEAGVQNDTDAWNRAIAINVPHGHLTEDEARAEFQRGFNTR